MSTPFDSTENQTPQNPNQGQPWQADSYPQTNQGQWGYTDQYGQPQYGAPAPDQYWQGQPVNYGPAGQGGSGFFGALFDFSFSQYITQNFARVIYIISIVIIALSWVAEIGFAIEESADATDLTVMLLMFTILSALALLMSRVSLEFLVATVRNELNTRSLAESQGQR